MGTSDERRRPRRVGKLRKGPAHSRRPWLIGLLSAAYLAAAGWAAFPPEDGTLQPGESVRRPLAAGEVHTYNALLTAGQWVVQVNQHRVDAIVEVCLPDEGCSIRADTFFDGQGSEWIAFPVPLSREYVLRIEGRIGAVASGDYELYLLPDARSAPARRAADLFTRAAMASARFKDAGIEADLQTAASLYAQAAESWGNLGAARRRAESLHLLALGQRMLDQRQAALQTFANSLEAWSELGSLDLQASALNDMALIHRDLGQPDRAAEQLQQAMVLFRQLGDTYSEAIVGFNLCRLEHAAGRLREAESCYLRVLDPLRLSGVTLHLGNVLNSLGGVYYQLGEPQTARRYFASALEQFRRGGHPEGEAETLNNRASLYRYLGSWQQALRDYERALELQRQVGDRLGEGRVLNNLGYGFLALGDTRQAAEYLELALALRRQVGDRAGQGVTLNNLGTLYQQLGNAAKALEFRRWALDLRRRLGQSRHVALTQIWMARDLRTLGRGSEALDLLHEAIELLEELGDRRFLAHGRSEKGRVLLALGRPAEGRDDLLAALTVQEEIEDVWGEVETRVALAQTERRLGHVAAALGQCEVAMERIEMLRLTVPTPELRATFLAAKGRAYELAIELAMDRHRNQPTAGLDRRAWYFSERSRSRALLDLLQSAADDGERRAQGDTEWHHRYVGLLERQRFLEARRLRQRSRSADGASVDVLTHELASVQQQLQELRQRHSVADALGVETPTVLDSADLQQLLTDDTVLLQLALGERQSFLWWVTAEGFESHRLPPRSVLEPLALEVHRDLATPVLGPRRSGDSKIPPNASELLARQLLEPVADRLRRYRGRRLLFVPDGALHYVPLAALPIPGTGGELLVHDHPIAHLPSASSLAALRGRYPAAGAVTLAVFGDPVFERNDPRLPPKADSAKDDSATSAEVSKGTWRRLASSGREARVIAAMLPSPRVTLAMGTEANLERLAGSEIRRASIVHFATHGVFDATEPGNSGLMLSLWNDRAEPREGFLGLRQIQDLNWQAELVVLSGCRTALGKKVWGEGLMGLSHSVLQTGPQNVVASLWEVDDAATAQLMGSFYGAMLNDGLGPSSALRRAQLELRRSERYRDPFYWAGFIVQGAGE